MTSDINGEGFGAKSIVKFVNLRNLKKVKLLVKILEMFVVTKCCESNSQKFVIYFPLKI